MWFVAFRKCLLSLIIERSLFMKWDKYTLITRTDAVDILSACLPEAGIEGIEVEDNIPLSEEDTKGMFIDI